MNAPTMLEHAFGLDVSGALSPDSMEFMADNVCRAVFISIL